MYVHSHFHSKHNMLLMLLTQKIHPWKEGYKVPCVVGD